MSTGKLALASAAIVAAAAILAREIRLWRSGTWLMCFNWGSATIYPLQLGAVAYFRKEQAGWVAVDVNGIVHFICSSDDRKVERLAGTGPAERAYTGNVA